MSGALNRFQDLNLSERNPWAEAVLRSSRLFGPTAATLERAAEWEDINRARTLEEQLQALRQRQQEFYEQIQERQTALAEAAQRLREEAFRRGIAQEDEEKANALAFLSNLRQLMEQYGMGTPGTPEIPAINYPWNQPGFLTHITPEDQTAARAAQGTLPQDQPAVPATPRTPGNPVLTMLGQLMVPGASSAVVDLGIKALLNHLTQQGPVDYRAFLDMLSPDNPIRGIPWNAITESDIDQAIKWELGIRGEETERLRILTEAKSKAGDGKTAAERTDWIKEIDDAYETFSESNPKSIEQKTYKAGRVTGTQWIPNPQWLDKEAFIRKYYGDETWARYAQAKNLFGDKYKDEVGFYILKNGGVGKALENDLKEMPLNVAKELIARYNRENHTNYDLGYWVAKWEKAHGVR